MRAPTLLSSSLATISIASTNIYGCNIRHRKRLIHRTRKLAKTPRLVSFAQPPTQNAFGCTGGSKAVQDIIAVRPKTTSKKSREPKIDNRIENRTPTVRRVAASAAPTQKKQRIRFVPWAGKRGMLPHQHYSGVLDYEEYRYWLRAPLNANASIPASNVDNYFSTVSSSTKNTTKSSIRESIVSPQVSPRHLKPIYVDEHIIVANKPSGVLSVPGPRRHECVASLAYRYFGKSNIDMNSANHELQLGENNEMWQPLTSADNKQIDTMVVHRLDRDTSGVLMFARNADALKRLHGDFKDKRGQKVCKRYVALVCGHWNGPAVDSEGIATDEGEIDLPLVRDSAHPPFMRVATAETRLRQQQMKQQPQTKERQHLQSNEEQRRRHPGYLRMVGKEAKASMTTYRILSYEYLIDDCDRKNGDDAEGTNASLRRLPVTRVELTPVTGRTHQLRVHCAAVGHPIVGDSIYGYLGEGSPHGGLESDKAMDEAGLDLQRKIYKYWKRRHRDRSCRETTHNESAVEECMLCLHAYQLAIFHPFTGSPMMFECAAPF